MPTWKPTPSKIITAEQKTAAERESTVKAFEAAIQRTVDDAAKSKNYADGTAFASYATSTVPTWRAEAETFVAWRDAVWIYAYTELDKAMSGQRTIPTIDEFISELPSIEWGA